MKKPGSQIAANLTMLAALAGSAPLAAQQALSESSTTLAPALIEIDPTVEEKAVVDDADGCRLVGGHFGGQQKNCGGGTQAFVRKLGSGGSLVWERCAGTDGTCAQSGGLPLFEGSAIDGLVEASSVHGISSDAASGEVVVVGEAIVAADGGTGVTTSRVAFVTLLTADGGVIAQRTIGDLPLGPPVTDGCCLDLCDGSGGGGGGGGSGGGLQCGARGVDWLAGTGIALTGWCADPSSSNGVDVLVALYDENLAELWTDVLGSTAKDLGRAVTLNRQGQVFSTGYGLAGREFFVAKHTAAGVLDSYSFGGGPDDDEGHTISLDSLGDPVVDLFVTGGATYNGQSFGDPADGRQEFTLEVDKTDLSLKQAAPTSTLGALTTPDGGGDKLVQQVQPAPAPVDPPAPSLTLESYYIVIGQWGTGGLKELEASDNLFLHLYEGPDPTDPNHYLLRFGVVFDPSAAAFKLNTAAIELEADSCYTATMWLKGYLDDTLYQVGTRQVCAADQPILRAIISPELSAALGFDGVLIPGPGDKLSMEIELDFGTYSCPLCSTQGEDGSVDEIQIEPEF